MSSQRGAHGRGGSASALARGWGDNSVESAAEPRRARLPVPEVEGSGLVGNASRGWALVDGPAAALEVEGTGGGDCCRLSEEDALYVFSRKGGAEVDVYRRSLTLERLVCDDVAALDPNAA